MLKVRFRFQFINTIIVCLLLLVNQYSKEANSVKPPEFQLVSKPTVTQLDRRIRSQPTVPDNYRELPYIETASEPELTETEKQLGYMLFQRSIVDPVYPNTRPLPYERLTSLTAFAAAGEFEPVTFSVYPERDLKNFRVQVSSLRSSDSVIDASWITVRLVSYWNVGYPRYTSRDTYRRVPELLERVNVHSSSSGECQRWWIQIHVPNNAKPGMYKGSVTVWDDGFSKAVKIPLSLRVLGFQLQSDPAKHYSSYYYVRNSVQYKEKDEPFIQKATENEYQAMVDYGLDMLPTFYLRLDDTKNTIVIRYEEELHRMLKAGLKGPLPVTADSVISSVYRQTTPEGKRENHWRISKMPPPEFYEKVTELFKTFKAECKAKGLPEVICCPIDEVAASHKEFGWRVYKAVHDSGVRTYATKNPISADSKLYQPYIDIWCSQPYSMPYKKIIAQNRYEYWCYPNHNAGEIKDRRVMCKGGRMTYGFGFWRSGYTTLIPWNWNWTPAPDQFDYLRGSRSGCGQRIGDDAEPIPSVYWDCFREGRDDARYIYTLQQAIVEREGSKDRHCLDLVKKGKVILQETWDAINVQQKYLSDGMWPSAEFNARRWRMAMMITSLLAYPATEGVVAPSVLVQKIIQLPESNSESIIDIAKQQNIIEAKNLLDSFSEWRNDTKEGKVEDTLAAGLNGNNGLRWHIKIDHENDGGEGGQYPVGWPRLRRNFQDTKLDMSSYDYLDFNIRVDSDRDEVSDDSTPIGIIIGSHKQSRNLYSREIDLKDQQRVWIPIRLSIKEMIQVTGAGLDPWKSISRIQLYISEDDYDHQTNITFDLSSIQFLRFTSPMISNLEVPRYVILPNDSISVPFQVVGMSSVKKGSHQVAATILDKNRKSVSSIKQDLDANKNLIIDISNITPGDYTLSVEIIDSAGNRCSTMIDQMEGLAGPELFTFDQ
jgi:hypothetical protein